MINLESIRECFEGAIPSVLATSSCAGIPNVVYISQVEYVDDQHIALTFQFFNKTRHNILENPKACLRVVSPVSGNTYELQISYLRTENQGPTFEKMKAKLSGIASHTGMSGIFDLLGSDIYSVTQIQKASALPARVAPQKINYLSVVNKMAKAISLCDEFDSLIETCLTYFQQEFGITHGMFFIGDEQSNSLFNCGSFGYPHEGVGAEISFGDGVIGVAARERTSIRISHMTSEYGYNYAMRQRLQQSDLANTLEKTIPFPGLPDSRSQIAVPLVNRNKTLGAVYFESLYDLAFDYDHENIFETLGVLIAAQLQLVNEKIAAVEDTAPETIIPNQETRNITSIKTIDYYSQDQSIFIDNDYVIKGVAGAILWLLLNENQRFKKTQFSNRELRLNKGLGLPEIADNLEARLTLLQKRLTEKQLPISMVKAGRGRFSFTVQAPLALNQKD